MGENNTGSIIAGAAALGGQLINWGSQGSMNKKTRKWNEEMYEKQRANALSDWNMQNAYNSPAAQMARYKAAGLNPNLIYGQSNTSDVVRNADYKSYNPTAPQVDLGQVTSSYFNTRQSQIQMDLVRKQIELADYDLKFTKPAAIAKMGAETANKEWKTYFDQSLADITKESKQASLEQTRANTQFTLDENARKAALQGSTLQQAAINVLKTQLELAKTKAETSKIYQEIANLRKDGTIKDFEIDLNKSGISKGDPAWLRAVENIVNKAGGNLWESISPKAFNRYVNSKVSNAWNSGKKWLSSKLGY